MAKYMIRYDDFIMTPEIDIFGVETSNKVKVYRIVYTEDFVTTGPEFNKIKRGDLGGYVSDDRCLSSDGLSYISQDVILLPFSYVGGDAFLNGNIIVCGGASIKENCSVYGNLIITKNIVGGLNQSIVITDDNNGLDVLSKNYTPDQKIVIRDQRHFNNFDYGKVDDNQFNFNSGPMI